MVQKISAAFQAQFGAVSLIVRSPGRVNIIGEHTDYNDGFVLPAAIDKAIYVAVSKREDTSIHLFSVDYNEFHEVLIADIQPTGTWSTYILGVVDQLVKRGHSISGFNLVIDGDVPIGAGLSSSAAVEAATAFALNELYALGIDRMELVRIAQKAEQVYSGVMCGIMDMFASVFGKKDHAIKLDCRSLEYQYVPLQLDGYKIVLLNTNVKHSLASSAYNERRQQCEQGVQWIQPFYPAVKNLRDVTILMLNEQVQPKDGLVYKRCKFVVDEIDRLRKACLDLADGNLEALGLKMYDTHEGLSKSYDVSCKELDYLVDAVKAFPEVLGARMMGGGFGGCTINIIREDAIDSIVAKLSDGYRQSMALDLTSYIAVIDDGTSLVSLPE